MLLLDKEGTAGILSRDEVVEKGMEAADVSEQAYAQRRSGRPSIYMYKVKLKSGRRATVNKEYQAWNIPHMKALAIIDCAEENEALSAVMIGRVMKSQMRSPREDY